MKRYIIKAFDMIEIYMVEGIIITAYQSNIPRWVKQYNLF